MSPLGYRNICHLSSPVGKIGDSNLVRPACLHQSRLKFSISHMYDEFTALTFPVEITGAAAVDGEMLILEMIISLL